MDTAQWPQGIGLMKPMEELVGAASNNNNNNITGSNNNNNNSNNSTRATSQVVERRTRPQKEQALNCPRCNSTNTKFCYYNNYSLTQPRYFCKTCRRYWTEGGSLRNVPVGGGSRKTKRSSCTSNTTTMATTATTSTASMTAAAAATTTSSIRGQDLNLAFPNPRNMADFGDLPNMDSNSNSTNQSTSLSAMDLLRSGMSVRGLSPFIPMPMSMPDAGSVVYPPGFTLHDFKPPSLSFPLDGGMQAAVQENAGRLLFPFEDLRQVTSNNAVHEFEQNRGGQGASDPQGFWHGMMGGGGGGGGGGGSW